MLLNQPSSDRRRRVLRSAAPVLVAGACLLARADAASAIYIRDDRSVSSYNTLLNKPAFNPVGFITDVDWGGSSAYASGTLVTTTKVLTAAHVVDGDADGKVDDPTNVKRMMFGTARNVPGTVTPNVKSVVVNPAYKGGKAAYDLAVITLSRPITSVKPAVLWGGNVSGQRGALIGYGYQGTGKRDFLSGAADKLAAFNKISKLKDGTYLTDFDSPARNTSSFDSPVPLTYEGTTAPGDSGSPLMADFGGDVWRVAGVLDGGYNPISDGHGGQLPDSWYGDISVYASFTNAANQSFLKAQGLTLSGLATSTARSADVYGPRSADPVPEPTGLAVVGAAVFGLLTRRRRR